MGRENHVGPTLPQNSVEFAQLYGRGNGCPAPVADCHLPTAMGATAPNSWSRRRLQFRGQMDDASTCGPCRVLFGVQGLVPDLPQDARESCFPLYSQTIGRSRENAILFHPPNRYTHHQTGIGTLPLSHRALISRRKVTLITVPGR